MINLLHSFKRRLMSILGNLIIPYFQKVLILKTLIDVVRKVSIPGEVLAFEIKNCTVISYSAKLK